jgi:ribokinase
MFDIVTIGSATRDGFFQDIKFVSIKDKRFRVGKGICLPLGSKLEAPKVSFLTGGSATNTATSFSYQGLKTSAICRVGHDVSGESILRELKEDKVDCRFVQIDHYKPTAYSVIFLTHHGQRTILSHKGAAEDIKLKEIPLDQINTKWLVLGSLGKDKNIFKTLITWARKNHIFLATNPGYRELTWLKHNSQWLDNFDIFICNQEEASYLTGIPYQQEHRIFKKLDQLVKGIVVMTKGPQGASISNGQFLWQVKPISIRKIVDETGAGDAFTSGFVSVFVKNRNFNEEVIIKAIRVGLLNATSVIQYIGAKPGILSLKELKKKAKTRIQIKKIVL